MHLTQLFEYRTSETEYTTKYRRLYHLTDNYGLGISTETNTLKALRQNYISTTHNRTTTGILGRSHYHYKFILNAKMLAADYGVFGYDHQVGVGSMDNLESANEDEIGIDTTVIEDLSKYLVGLVIMNQPYSENQILFLAAVNKNSRGMFSTVYDHTIPAITAINRMTVPLYWQNGAEFIPLSPRDHEYLKDIEIFMHEITETKRASRHLDILEKLLQKYDIKDDSFHQKKIDYDIIFRRRMIPVMTKTLNKYYANRPYTKVNPMYLESMLKNFLHLMNYGDNISGDVIQTAKDNDFFHYSTQAVAWTGMLRNLVNGDVENALECIKDERPDQRKIEWMESEPDEMKYRIHHGTGMSGDSQ